MKKQYIAPNAQAIMIGVEGMLASSDPSQAHDEISTGTQLSNGKSGWDSSHWANGSEE